MAFAATITDSQLVRVVVSGAVDKKGNPAPLDGTPTFKSDNEAVATFATDPADASGMTGVVTAVGPLGTANLSIEADAQIGEGVTTISEPGLVQVVAGQAVSMTATVGTPEEQP